MPKYTIELDEEQARVLEIGAKGRGLTVEESLLDIALGDIAAITMAATARAEGIPIEKARAKYQTTAEETNARIREQIIANRRRKSGG